MLYGNEESVYKQFQEDKQKWKFSKERAVTLKIQLIAKRYLNSTIFYTNGNMNFFLFFTADCKLAAANYVLSDSLNANIHSPFLKSICNETHEFEI